MVYIPNDAIPDPEYPCWKCAHCFSADALRFVYSRLEQHEDKGCGFVCTSCYNLIDVDDFTLTNVRLSAKTNGFNTDSD